MTTPTGLGRIDRQSKPVVRQRHSPCRARLNEESEAGMSALSDAVFDLGAALEHAERVQNGGHAEASEALRDLVAAAPRVVDNWDNC